MRIPPPPIAPAPSAALLAAVLLVVASAAGAQVPDGAWAISDDKDSGASADLQISGGAYAAEINAVCVPFPEGNSTTGSAIQVTTNHPDKVKLKKDRGALTQQDKTYQPTVRFITGSGTLRKTTIASCKKVELEAGIKTKHDPNTGSFAVKARKCDCPLNVEGTCDAFANQLLKLETDCASHKAVSTSFDTEKDVVNKLTIKGKGDAVTPD
jgi:hypothetical protein